MDKGCFKPGNLITGGSVFHDQLVSGRHSHSVRWDEETRDGEDDGGADVPTLQQQQQQPGRWRWRAHRVLPPGPLPFKTDIFVKIVCLWLLLFVFLYYFAYFIYIYKIFIFVNLFFIYLKFSTKNWVYFVWIIFKMTF